MSARGVKFLFSPGEAVLCFEPDPTKARVLYDAKVLDTNVGKGRVAEYHIHFQGWNSSWDRIVPEDFVLRNTEEHRNVMKRIAKIARKVKRNKMRKKKIDKILDRVLRRSRRGGGEGSGGDDESDMSEDKDCESDDSEEEDSDTGSTGDDDSDGRLGARGPGSDKSDGPASSSEHHVTSEDEEEEVDLDRIPELKLEIPDVLKKHLEDDCYFVLRKNKLVHLPADPNIITILEGYVKSFAINILCASTEKVRVRGEQQPTPPERNIELCKEVVDGLRLMFDFILPTRLLYNVEKTHHTNLQATFKPPFAAKSDSEGTDEPPPAVPMSPRGRTTRQSVSSPPAEPPPKIPRLSPKNIKKEPVEDEDEAPTRRLTRKALAEAERAGKSLDQPPVMEKSPVLESKEMKVEMSVKERRRSKAESRKTGRELRRSSTRLNSSGSQASNSKSSSEGRTLSQRITPPPPLLLPSVMSSKTSSAHVTPTLKSVNTGTSASRATSNFAPPEHGAQLNGILSWRLIPPEVYAETPPPPSVIYGVHHLLRLFVKLPEFVNCMPMPHNKRVVLQKHLDMILEYLVENTELFPESAYVDAPASSPMKPDARRR